MGVRQDVAKLRNDIKKMQQQKNRYPRILFTSDESDPILTCSNFNSSCGPGKCPNGTKSKCYEKGERKNNDDPEVIIFIDNLKD